MLRALLDLFFMLAIPTVTVAGLCRPGKALPARPALCTLRESLVWAGSLSSPDRFLAKFIAQIDERNAARRESYSVQ